MCFDKKDSPDTPMGGFKLQQAPSYVAGNRIMPIYNKMGTAQDLSDFEDMQNTPAIPTAQGMPNNSTPAQSPVGNQVIPQLSIGAPVNQPSPLLSTMQSVNAGDASFTIPAQVPPNTQVPQITKMLGSYPMNPMGVPNIDIPDTTKLGPLTLNSPDGGSVAFGNTNPFLIQDQNVSVTNPVTRPVSARIIEPGLYSGKGDTSNGGMVSTKSNQVGTNNTYSGGNATEPTLTPVMAPAPGSFALGGVSIGSPDGEAFKVWISNQPVTVVQPTPAPAATVDPVLLNHVKDLEGFTPKAYKDNSQLSVGYGTKAKSPNEVLTEPEAEQRLNNELSQSKSTVQKAASKSGIPLTQNQLNALTSFDYNTGAGAKVLSQAKNAQDIASKMSQYTKENGQESPGLVNRRKAELAMFFAQN